MNRIFKNGLAIMMAVLVAFGSITLFSAKADAVYNGNCGDSLEWSLDKSTGALTVSGTGAMKEYSTTYIPWRSVRSEIKSVSIGDGVTSVCNYAFYDCANLAEISIAATVTQIGTLAFAQSPSITAFSVDSENPNYSSDIYGVLFDKNFTQLIQYPSGNNQANYEVPASVTAVYEDSFRFAKNITGVSLPDGLESIGEEAFYGSGLTSVTIPSCVTSIGKNAFGWCPSLKSISVNTDNPNYSSDEYGVLFNKSKTELIKYPNNCVQTDYIIPDGVTTIADDAFENCYKLSYVTIPSSTVSIGKGVFFNCYLKGITVNSANQNYSSDDNGVLFSKDKTELIQYPIRNEKTDYIIPDGVVTVKESSFQNCQTLKSITVPESVTNIEDYAFMLCGNLEFVHLTSGTTSIGQNVIGTSAYLCAETENCYAKDYAETNGLSFKVCSGHNADGISISTNEVEIINKQTYKLEATVTPDTAADKSVIWESDNSAVATVDEKGLVTAVSAGTANITATTADGAYSAVCKVTVTPRYFNITWIVDGKETVQSVAEGAVITKPDTPEKIGHTFKGWNGEIPATMPAESLTFKALWTANSYDAVFDANGGVFNDGSTTKTHSVVYGSDIYTPRIPSRQGYEFIGWTPETGIMDDINGKEFTAEWAALTDTKYTVEIYTMEIDGTYTNTTDVLTGTTDTTATAEYTVETGFKLNEENSVLSGNIAPDGSLVLKVYLDREIYKATINGVTSDYLHGQQIAEPEKPDAPTGYLQQGWIDENGASVEFPLVAGGNLPSEIKPDFVKQSYTVTWIVDSNKTEETYLFESKINAPADPVKTGYTFTGWTPAIPDSMPAESMVFTATWSANSYKAVFDANSGAWADGSTKKTVTANFDEEIIAPENPVKSGYIFAGWTPEVGIMNDVNGKTYKALWIVSTETVYTVEIYTMSTDGTYTKVTQTFTGATDSTVNAKYTVEEGFILNNEKSVLSGKVAADNSLVLTAYIDRLTYTLTTIVDGVSSSKEYIYGSIIAEPNTPSKAGYDFIGWDKEIPQTMPAEDLTITAKFEKSTYTCPDCLTKFDDEAKYNEHIAYEQAKKNIRVSIKNKPDTKTIKYGETLRLTAVTSAALPEGTKICWYVDGVKAAEGETFDISFNSGTKSVTVKITDSSDNALKDANGNEISDSQKVSVNSSFWQKIVSFFKNLFRMNRTVIQTLFTA